MGRREHNVVRRRFQDCRCDLIRPMTKLSEPAGIDFMGLGHDHDALGSGTGIRNAEGNDTSLANARYVPDGFFHLMRIDVAACPLDHIFASAGDEHIARDRVSEIAGIEPAIAEELLRFRGIAEITRRRRWSAELQPSFPPVFEFAADDIEDADLMTWQCPAAS